MNELSLNSSSLAAADAADWHWCCAIDGPALVLCCGHSVSGLSTPITVLQPSLSSCSKRSAQPALGCCCQLLSMTLAVLLHRSLVLQVLLMYPATHHTCAIAILAGQMQPKPTEQVGTGGGHEGRGMVRLYQVLLYTDAAPAAVLPCCCLKNGTSPAVWVAASRCLKHGSARTVPLLAG